MAGFHYLSQRRAYINQVTLSYIYFVFSQVTGIFLVKIRSV